MSVLTEKWHTWYIGGVFEILTSKSIFGQIWAQKFKVVCFVWKLVHIVSQGCWFRIRLRFLKFWPQNLFWANLGQKCQSFSFCLKIDTHVLSRLLILVPTLIFWISKLKSIFGQVVVYFDWQLTHMVYWGCWFLFWQ